MTITIEQLDELERKAERVQDAIAASRPLRCVFDEYVEANSPDITLQLVSIARAALEWRAQITTLSLASGLPQQVWAELCRLDSEMADTLRGAP